MNQKSSRSSLLALKNVIVPLVPSGPYEDPNGIVL